MNKSPGAVLFLARKEDGLASNLVIVAASAPYGAHNLAPSGWIVEVVLVVDDRSSDHRSFAVGFETAEQAENAVLRYPGIEPADRRTALRQLSSWELWDLKLRPEAIRPYDYHSRPPANTQVHCEPR